MFNRITNLDELKEVYPSVYPFLEDAIAVNREQSLDAVLASIIRGDSQLWVAGEDEVLGAVVTEVIQYPECRKMCIHLCAGKDLYKWLDIGMASIEELAADSDCVAVAIYGRTGWKKLLKDYDSTCIVLEKRL